MTEHFPKSTETATGWCKQCNRNTEHRVDGGRLGPCLACMEQAKKNSQHPHSRCVRASPSLARTRGEYEAEPPELRIVQSLTMERMKIRIALRDLLHFYDRADQSGYTTADVLRIAEIRRMACPERSEG